MLKVKVATLYLGRVALRDRYILEAKETGQDILVLHGDGEMLLKNSELDSRIVGRSEKQVFDRFSRDQHYLIYYTWDPEVRQGTLEII